MVQIYSGTVLALIFVGFLFRRKRKVHIPIMIVSFVLDLISVFYLELSRDVIFKAYDTISKELMQIHLLFAVVTLVGYGIAMYTGRKIAKGAPISALHRINAFCFLTARTGVFVTSFWVLKV